MKKKLIEFISQIIPVMIGVYLGFVLSNWSESNKIKSQSEQLRSNIIAEIESNKNKLVSVIDYHSMVRDSSIYYKNITRTEKMPAFFNGIQTITLMNSAFETGIQTGLINTLEFDEIQQLNSIYTLQSANKDFNNLLLSGLVMTDFEENGQGVKKFFNYLAISMTDVVLQEKKLIKDYNELLSSLDK